MKACNYFNNTYTILYPTAIVKKNGLILELRIILHNDWYGGKQITLPTTEILTANFPIQKKQVFIFQYMLSFSWYLIEFRKWNERHVLWEVNL